MIRLLGDMRSYNYVVIPIHDFDQVIYKIRAIDFDQQCFEGKFSVYRPQFFKENEAMMDLVRAKLKSDSINQYKIEERSTISRRLIISDERMKLLIGIMKDDTVSIKENVVNLKKEIFKFTGWGLFFATKNEILLNDFLIGGLPIYRYHEVIELEKLW